MKASSLPHSCLDLCPVPMFVSMYVVYVCACTQRPGMTSDPAAVEFRTDTHPHEGSPRAGPSHCRSRGTSGPTSEI
eukprot:scaffold315517_cov36-Tisochrysis_lutea.AAC.2